MESTRMFEESFFKGRKRRVKVVPTGTVENGILTLMVQSTDENNQMTIEIKGPRNEYTNMDFIKMEMADFLLIEWLERPVEGCFFISKEGEAQNKACFIQELNV